MIKKLLLLIRNISFEPKFFSEKKTKIGTKLNEKKKISKKYLIETNNFSDDIEKLNKNL